MDHFLALLLHFTTANKGVNSIKIKDGKAQKKKQFVFGGLVTSFKLSVTYMQNFPKLTLSTVFPH